MKTDSDDDKEETDSSLGSMLDDQTFREIILMSKAIFSNPTPIREQQDILRKMRILNYAIAEWCDEFDRRHAERKKRLN
jgi:hypothetical protein